MSTHTDREQETVVLFTIRPALDESRWEALAEAARVAGAVSAHVNPPELTSLREQNRKLTEALGTHPRLVRLPMRPRRGLLCAFL